MMFCWAAPAASKNLKWECLTRLKSAMRDRDGKLRLGRGSACSFQNYQTFNESIVQRLLNKLIRCCQIVFGKVQDLQDTVLLFQKNIKFEVKSKEKKKSRRQ